MSNPTERAIFLQAIDEEDPVDRLAYLESACGGDLRLRESVEALLVAHEQPAALLDHPIVSDASHPAFHEIVSDDTIDHLGMMIGPFRLMEQIGEGGFGLVFVAEQEQPVRRRVALKILKPGSASKEVLARFESERQAVAMMNHPNIAQIFDAGVTSDHRPYFVMELVRGLPITDFCDHQKMSVRERLHLMIDICFAVHHAHQKGIIHRDIKPSNVMVTLHDGKPVAKVIDFGVAKAIGNKLTDQTVYTRFLSMIGTPLYMSPEQAEMSGLDVDTRSDIFSLGVLLYELLAGTTPFDRSRMDSAGLDEIRRIIREEEPLRPSNRVTTQAKTLSTVADQRGLGTHRLVSTLEGDLDWIVMKALEKDRTRRYDSAASLADDIHRYLNGEPIFARPPSALYQFQKFARRYRAVIITAGLVGCSLILGTAVSVWQMSKAIAAQRKLGQFAENLTRSSVLVASGQTHADAGRYRDAARDYDAAVSIQPTYFLPRIQRAQLYSELFLWTEAAEDYRFVLNSGVATSQPQWMGVTALFLYTAHEDAFVQLAKQHRVQLLADPHEPKWSTLRALLICGTDDAWALRHGYAERAERWLSMPPPRPQRRFEATPGNSDLAGPDASRLPRPYGPPPGRPGNGRGDDRGNGRDNGRGHERLPPEMCLYVVALAHLRDGNFESSISFLREANATTHWPDQFLSLAPLALAFHHNGQTEQAKRALQRSTASIQAILDDLPEHSQQSTSIRWNDLVEALQLHEEASEAILGTRSLLTPKVNRLRRSSLNLIAQPASQTPARQTPASQKAGKSAEW